MFKELRPFADAAATLIPWLPSAPSHWKRVPGLGVLREVSERNRGLREEVVLSLSYGRVVVKSAERLHGLVPASFETYQVLEPGDIVVRPTDLQNDQRSARVGLVRDRGIITSAYLGFRVAAHALPEFTYLQLAALDSMKVYYGMGSGLRQNLEWSDFKRLPLVVPTRGEQVAIVKYLAHAHGRIDRAIATKRRLIALLEEQKQAIINQAVTRGLDPAAPLRETRIPWLGQVPAHWELQRLKQVARSLDRHRVPLSSEVRGVMSERGYEYYGASGVIDMVDDYLFDEPLLLIAEDGANLVLRNLPLALIATGKYWVNNHAHVLRVEHGSLEFMAYRLECLSFVPLISGAAQPKLTQDRLMSIALALPTPSEQVWIVEFLQEATATTISTIGRIRSEIELLREFRARLTSDVVTGQLDVRHIAATLPDLDPEEPTDDVGPAEDDLVDEAAEFLEGVDA